jgi:hypothetical protein
MRKLRPDELLAAEPGNLPLEIGRHRQFARINVPHTDGREWYAPEPPLLAHIARLNLIYEPPTLRPRRVRNVRTDRPQSALRSSDNGEQTYDEMDDEALLAVAAISATGREALYEVTTRLSARGWTFAQIAAKLGVHEATASRWAKPPAEDRRRRKSGPVDSG